MSEFLKSGNRVVAKPSGLDYKLETNKLYYLKYDSWEGTTYLEINNGDLKLPETLIYSDSENNFVTKILSYFKRTNKQTTGVLLNGLKGSGKTVMAKLIARNSNLPIIIVSSDCPTRHVSTFFSKFKDTETCVIFDEIDTGISGRVGVAVSKKLHKISQNSQTIVISHLPQVASNGEHTFFVKKIVKDGSSLKN